MKQVPVPRVPAAAYNPNRPASDLVKTQIRQLQAAILAAVDSEGEAALCIRVLTTLLRDVRPRVTPVRYGASRRRKGRVAARRKVSKTATRSRGRRRKGRR
jgi:hypothetical protein